MDLGDIFVNYRPGHFSDFWIARFIGEFFDGVIVSFLVRSGDRSSASVLVSFAKGWVLRLPTRALTGR